MTAVYLTKRWVYSLQTRGPATILALAALFWCSYYHIDFPGIEEPMEILRLSPLTISASIAYAEGSKNISIAMILCFCTSLFHFDFFTNYTVLILQSGVLLKESLKNSYQLGIIASACFSRELFLNVFKSSSALEKNKRILIETKN